MKIARLLDSNNETYGIVKDGYVATKEQLTSKTGIPLPQDIKNFLFDGWFNEIKEKECELSCKEKLSKFKFLSPIPNPSKIICLAFNYIDHAEEQNIKAPEDPVIFLKPRNSLIGTKSEIICPSIVKELDYEIELALIIGKTCKNLEEDEVTEAIFGYLILNDVTARDIQRKDKQFTRGKGFDTFAPCGPWITTSDEIC